MVKATWCLPEDKALSAFLGLGLPSVLNSVRLLIPRPQNLGQPVACQFICNSPFPFFVPDDALPPGYTPTKKFLKLTELFRVTRPDIHSSAVPGPIRIVLNMHGGGFVAGSPQTHET